MDGMQLLREWRNAGRDTPVLICRRHGVVTSKVIHGGIEFDPAARSVTLNGDTVTLTPCEVAVLELFLNNKGRVLARTLIQEKLYSWDDEVSSNAAEVHIHHLRSKLGKGFIRPVHGVGYTLGDAQSGEPV